MSSNLGANSDVEKLARQARKGGIEVFITRSNHLRWLDPKTGDFLTSGLTMSDMRRIKAIKKWLRLRGVKC